MPHAACGPPPPIVTLPFASSQPPSSRAVGSLYASIMIFPMTTMQGSTTFPPSPFEANNGKLTIMAPAGGTTRRVDQCNGVGNPTTTSPAKSMPGRRSAAALMIYGE